MKQLMATSRLTKQVAALNKADKEWVNDFVAKCKAKGLKFDRSFVKLMGSYIVVLSLAGGDSVAADIESVLKSYYGKPVKRSISAKLGPDGHKYVSWDLFDLKFVLKGSPTYITVDELYGTLYIQF